MKLGLSLGMQQTQKQSLRLEQRQELKQKQELQLKQSLEQIIKLVQKLTQQMTQKMSQTLSLKLSQKMKTYLKRELKRDVYFRETLNSYMQDNPQPTARQLQQDFPQMIPVFNEYYRSQPNYGRRLRQQQVAPRRRREDGGMTMSMGLGLTLRLTQSLKITMPTIPWSLVDAYKEEKDKGCQLPKSKMEGLDGMSLDDRLRKMDEANELFRFAYTKKGRKHYKIPLLRDFNVDPGDIAVEITGAEYRHAQKVLNKAGRVQRIVRSIPFGEIRDNLLEYMGHNDLDIDDVVIVGVDRGGRLPTHIVKNALGKDIAYFLKVDQGHGRIDDARLQQHINKGTFAGKHVLFVDSTVDSGRQISAIAKYFDDADMGIGHTGWTVVGSNEYGSTLQNHLQLDWGVDPDTTFEDNPELMGVDYAHGAYNKVRACGNKMSTFLKKALLEVPRGYVLDTSTEAIAALTKKKRKKKSKKLSAQDTAPVLLIIGDGSYVTVDDGDAANLALKLENGFQVIAGTPEGNPGDMLERVAEYDEGKGTVLFQPGYMEDSGYDTKGFQTVYVGDSKEQFRDHMVEQADVVLALGGNKGTLSEIRKTVAAGKPVVVYKDSGTAADIVAEELDGTPGLHLVDSIDDAVRELAQYRQN